MSLCTHQLLAGEWVGYFLPDLWWQKLGDVCVDSFGTRVFFIERDSTFVDVIDFFPLSKSPCDPIKLSHADADHFCAVMNHGPFSLTGRDMARISNSSMRKERPHVFHRNSVE